MPFPRAEGQRGRRSATGCCRLRQSSAGPNEAPRHESDTDGPGAKQRRSFASSAGNESVLPASQGRPGKAAEGRPQGQRPWTDPREVGHRSAPAAPGRAPFPPFHGPRRWAPLMDAPGQTAPPTAVLWRRETKVTSFNRARQRGPEVRCVLFASAGPDT